MDVVRIDPHAEVHPDPDNPGESYVTQFVGADPALTVGIWAADGYETEFDAYPFDEMCVVLAGEITLTTAEAGRQVFSPGDIFALQRGTALTWSQTDGTRKVFVILESPAEG